MQSAAGKQRPNEWLEAIQVEQGSSFLRLVYAFELGVASMRELRTAMRAATDSWELGNDQIVGDSTLTRHVQELFQRPANAPSLLVFHYAPARNGPKSWPKSASWVRPRSASRAGSPEVALNFGASRKDRWFGPSLWLFDMGLGYLTIDVRPASDQASVWLDALHCLRLGAAERAGKVRFHPEEDQAGAGARGDRTLYQLASEWLASLLPWDAADGGGIEPIDLRNQLRSFAALYFRSSPLASPPHDLQRRLLYQICDLAPSWRPLDPPIGAGADHVRGAYFEYSQQAYFVATREGCAFVACDKDLSHPFWRENMPEHLRQIYFTVYLLTQYQRQAIERLRRLVADHGRDAQIANDEWLEIRKLSAKVKSHGFFVELAQSNNHSRFERMVRDLAEVDRLFDLTTKAVDATVALQIEAHEQAKAEHVRLQEADARRRQRAWTIAGGTLAAPTLLFTLLNVNIRGWTTGPEEGLSWAWVLSLGIASGLVGCLGSVWLIGGRERRN
jgi:hypothetical protein